MPSETDLDLADFICGDLSEWEEDCPFSTLYKYYFFPDLSNQLEFFRRPSIRFTEKAGLNDPFELTKRWEKFGFPMTRVAFDKYLRKGIHDRITDDEYLIEEAVKSFPAPLATPSRAEIAARLRSREGRFLLSALRQQAEDKLEFMLDIIFSMMGKFEGQMMETFASGSGILSLTEDHANKAMWSLYAGNGQGFVLEIDVGHEMLRADPAHKPLRKVQYRNDRIEDFWRNPYYLFLVKDESYSFEREWRIVKNLSDCERHDVAGRTLYRLFAVPGVIKSVIFGYSASAPIVEASTNVLKAWDPQVRIKKAHLNLGAGIIDIEDLD